MNIDDQAALLVRLEAVERRISQLEIRILPIGPGLRSDSPDLPLPFRELNEEELEHIRKTLEEARGGTASFIPTSEGEYKRA